MIEFIKIDLGLSIGDNIRQYQSSKCMNLSNEKFFEYQNIESLLVNNEESIILSKINLNNILYI